MTVQRQGMSEREYAAHASVSRGQPRRLAHHRRRPPPLRRGSRDDIGSRTGSQLRPCHDSVALGSAATKDHGTAANQLTALDASAIA